MVFRFNKFFYHIFTMFVTFATNLEEFLVSREMKRLNSNEKEVRIKKRREEEGRRWEEVRGGRMKEQGRGKKKNEGRVIT